MRTLFATAAATAAAAIALTVTISQPAQAAGGTYVALGDSYSAGVGTRNEAVPGCYRSPEGYPVLVARAGGLSLSYQACSGAVIGDVLNNQVGALNSSTTYATVSAGGNDALFVPALTECAKPGWMSNCNGKLDQSEALINNTIPGRLANLYSVMRSKAPNARRVAVGYPLIFNGTDCNALTFFSPAEMTRMNALTNKLDSVTAAQANSYGMRFADPRGAFAGHAVCSSSEYINGLSWPIQESYHPNDAGNRAYATVVAGVLGTPAVRVASQSSPQRALRQSATAADYAALVPDLATEGNLRRAEKAGISRGTIKRLDRDLRSGDRARAERAFNTLRALDVQTRR